MNPIHSTACVVLAISLLSGCAATTTINATQSGASIDVKSSPQASIPRTETYSTTSFGNYEFRAQSAGLDPFYGILPLKFNGGYLALDILFFAPAAFFNLREVYPFYEFDLEKKHVKFRSKEDEEWTVYVPLEAEASRSKDLYKGK
jgi:hypothetical protein